MVRGSLHAIGRPSSRAARRERGASGSVMVSVRSTLRRYVGDRGAGMVRSRTHMDETAMDAEARYRVQGFPGQRLCVVPRPQIDGALRRDGTRRLVVTD